jgi:hypothetical protein
MKTVFRPPVAALLLLSVSAIAAHAATDTFPTGQSYWGQPAAGVSESRTVVDAQTRHVRVMYGETVVFKDDTGKQFAWTFNGLDRSAVPVSKIAPADFHAARTVVYVGQNPLTRN